MISAVPIVVLFGAHGGTCTVFVCFWWHLGSSLSPCSVLWPLLALAAVVLAWNLFPGQSLGALLGEQSHFVCWRLMMDLTSEHPTGGVPM